MPRIVPRGCARRDCRKIEIRFDESRACFGSFVSSGQSELPSEPLKPAISVKKSIAPDYIVCLEDGKKFKSLKRHLRTQYNMTPEQYRDKWGLPADYPMVAPNYAVARSQLAKKMGLGQQRRRRK
jgi:predicted transcriptional regulator